MPELLTTRQSAELCGMATQDRRPTTAEKIEVLCRIFRAAVKSGDAELRATTARELAEYGVRLGDLIEAPEQTKGGNDESK